MISTKPFLLSFSILRLASIVFSLATAMAGCSAADGSTGDETDVAASTEIDPSILPTMGTVSIATSCATNCSSSCEVSYNYPCPTLRKPGRTCRGHTLDPACKARCEVERAVDCRTGINGCDLWEASSDWQRGRAALASLAPEGFTAAQCIELVNGGAAAAGAAGATQKVIEGGLSALFTVSKATVVSFVAAEAVKHGSICACRKALP